MKLQQLLFFQTACQCNSITAAAKLLHISQPSISAAIRNLEEEFGVKLIERRYQGFTVTEEGKAFLEMSEGLLNHSNKVWSRMMSIGSKHLPIHIGVSPMAGLTVLPTLHTDFLSRHPSIQICTEEGGTKSLLRGLSENTLDIAFVSHYSPIPSAYSSIPVMQTETMWCADKNHPLSKEPFLLIEQLKNERLVLFKNDFALHDLVRNRFQDINIAPHVIHETNQIAMVYTLIKSGIATGFLMQSVAPNFPDLAWIPIKPSFSAMISLVWIPTHSMTKDSLSLIEYYRTRPLM